ncbi:hypothetical protein SAMN05216276_103865 [Streptosporangium subroseum]|uniref:Uncharacterized protein n=2 Tax=Streptosporangium subroseum TaxID=106412 RepID=A0A239M765_9ACTN|nr:hypothetical protein SAMN05216276_103865 [Streptosporangium subroseum]
MARKIIISAVALLVLTPAARADADAPWGDPVRAVNALLAKGSGLTFKETGTVGMHYRDAGSTPTGTFRYNGGYIIRTKGAANLSRSGVVASKMTRTLEFDSGWRNLREQAAQGDPWAFDMNAQQQAHYKISVKGYSYASGPLYKPKVPAGKTWARLGKLPGADAAYGDQVINVFEPGTLKALMARSKRGDMLTFADDAHGKRHRVPFYNGNATFAQLFALSPTFRKVLGGRLLPEYRNIRIFWSMTFTKEGLPIQVTSGWERLDKSFPQQNGNLSTWYGFGPHAAIAPPPATRVATPNRQPLGDDRIDAFMRPFG